MMRFGPELKAIFFSHATDTSLIILVKAYPREVLETLWYSGKITRTRNHKIPIECLSTWTNGQATGQNGNYHIWEIMFAFCITTWQTWSPTRTRRQKQQWPKIHRFSLRVQVDAHVCHVVIQKVTMISQI